MKIKPTGGAQSHQVASKPAGRYEKSNRNAFAALKNSFWGTVKFKAAIKIPNKQEAKKTTKIVSKALKGSL